MKPDLYIRADGSAYFGLGHLVRSFSLAQYLKNHYRVTFVCMQIPENFKRELQNAQIRVIQIESETDFINTLDPNSIVVLDGYQFSEEYQKSIKQKKCKLVCIDDMNKGKYFAELIINQAPGVAKGSYNALPHTDFALGPDYALLRSPFIKIAGRDREINKCTSILICFGGSDVKNLTKQSLEIVQNFKQFKKIIIITGSAYEHEIDFDITTGSETELHRNVSAKTMAALMSQSDLAIVPASGILFEALAAGCRVISGFYNDNQLQIYKGFKKLEAFTDAKTFERDELISALKRVKPGKTKKIIDGKSPERVIKLFKKLSQKN